MEWYQGSMHHEASMHTQGGREWVLLCQSQLWVLTTNSHDEHLLIRLPFGTRLATIMRACKRALW